ncbi:MAG: hypothetical protein ABS89_08255 [Thiobacillus sp. SCN 63-1177]|nr:MAG: hypothetical protein ABS89_08255 [Thiobacillus sp. SCN 63-1177]OJW45283.1 MAG: hypothetical protein BGO60_08150 [Thiobacillus sp. 65-1059]
MLRVVKLGGSLHDSPWLAGWLDALARAGGRVVLVPGGGPFADAVRAAQRRCRFGEAAAHRLSLLAMEQYGLMLCDLEPDLLPAATTQVIADAIAHGRTPVWLPSSMCLGAPDIPESWSVTSDSLAVWLAHHLGAEALALVKHGEGDAGDIRALADAGLVDRAFPGFAARYAKPIHILSHCAPTTLDDWLAWPMAAPVPPREAHDACRHGQ